MRAEDIKPGAIFEFLYKTDPRGPIEYSARHPFAVIEIHGDEIVCCMITHSPPGKKFQFNERLDAHHFTDKPGVSGTPFYDSERATYFVGVTLIKAVDLFAPTISTTSAELSVEGIEFVKEKRQAGAPLLWADYLNEYVL